MPQERINVEVFQGAVTLTGTVDWYYQADAATRDACVVPGVKSVTNAPQVTPPAASADDIRVGIVNAFARNVALADDHVDVSMEGSHILRTGNVRTEGEREEARAIAWRSPGVIGVTDVIYVIP